jgi:DNA-binding CsgD family transcriptional regulator
MKDNEIYAPNYNDGDTVALVRYPHGGIFEIPILKVNNKQADAKKIMENASDAVGINTKVAEQLSGADFDGDTALVIPVKSNRLTIASSKQLEGLKDFDPKESYKLSDDAPKMTSTTKQNEMGRVSNLITDMTVGGASPKEIEKAVKHSMVVIDAEKHHLDYKQSAKDNDIQSLKKKYQGVNEETGMVKGASTILSKAGAEVRINQRKEVQDTSKMTDAELERWNNGQKVYRDTGATKTIRITDTSKMTPSELALHQAGKNVYRDSGEYKQEKVIRMGTVDDAMDLVRDSTNQKEVAYANYANTLKGLANEARKEARSIKPTPVSQSAKTTYADEVESLNAKLRLAQMNAPRERKAQAIANATVSEKLKSNPDMDYEHRQREKALALTKARAQVGAGKEKIVITDNEWEAIQANAITTNKLTQILNNTDQELFKQRATPKGSSTSLTNAQLNLILAMASSGMYTQKEIAERLGISTSTVSKAIREN